jgi:hypothetical protein
MHQFRHGRPGKKDQEGRGRPRDKYLFMGTLYAAYWSLSLSDSFDFPEEQIERRGVRGQSFKPQILRRRCQSFLLQILRRRGQSFKPQMLRRRCQSFLLQILRRRGQSFNFQTRRSRGQSLNLKC